MVNYSQATGSPDQVLANTSIPEDSLVVGLAMANTGSPPTDLTLGYAYIE